jgi:hypothetical protein
MRFLLLAACLLLPVVAPAADLNISWSAVTEYEDDNDPATLDTMPGSISYELWGSANGVLPRLLLTTAATSATRVGVSASNHCYYLVTVHKNSAGASERSAPSATSCKDLRTSPQTPPTPQKPRTSGIPRATASLVISEPIETRSEVPPP